MNNQNKDAIREEGGIELLIRMLHEGSQEAEAHAATFVANKNALTNWQLNPSSD